MKSSSKLIVALDVKDLKRAKELVDNLYPTVKIFKIGSQLFTAYGPRAVELVQRKGARVFLDLKFHDIPNTVAKAAVSATDLGVFMFTVHCLGGFQMMRLVKEASYEETKKLGIQKPLVLGVTLLTSIDQRDLISLGINRRIKDQVLCLAKLAKKAGLDGVIASPQEIRLIRKTLGSSFIIVTPGIRPFWAKTYDQRRTLKPKEAIDAGADYIVIGRPIIEAKVPLRAAEKIIEEINQ